MKYSHGSLRPSLALLFSVVAVACVTFLSGRPAHARTSEDSGLWLMLMMDGPIGSRQQEPGRFRWWLDVQPRFVGDVSGMQQGLFRPGIGYVLGAQTTAWLGYARIRTKSENGSVRSEDRIWQQLWWKPRIGSVDFQSRTRLEQRFLDTGSGAGWRFRQFFKASWDFPGQSRFGLAAYEEAFVDLNDTNWGQRSGFSQNRVFVGLGLKLGDQKRSKLELGYLNQYLSRPGSDRMRHILSANLFVTF